MTLEQAKKQIAAIEQLKQFAGCLRFYVVQYRYSHTSSGNRIFHVKVLVNTAPDVIRDITQLISLAGLYRKVKGWQLLAVNDCNDPAETFGKALGLRAPETEVI